MTKKYLMVVLVMVSGLAMGYDQSHRYNSRKPRAANIPAQLAAAAGAGAAQPLANQVLANPAVPAAPAPVPAAPAAGAPVVPAAPALALAQPVQNPLAGPGVAGANNNN